MMTRPDSELLDQLREQVEDLGLHHHVEGGGRLVGDDELRAAGERHRDHHALPLPAGQLVGVGGVARRREPDLVEKPSDPRDDLRLLQRRLVQPDRLRDLVDRSAAPG